MVYDPVSQLSVSVLLISPCKVVDRRCLSLATGPGCTWNYFKEMFHLDVPSISVVTGGVLFGMVLFQVTTKSSRALHLTALHHILVSTEMT